MSTRHWLPMPYVRNLLLATLTGALLTGCPDRVDENAEVRVIHLSPDAPAVDVWVRDPDVRIFDGLAFTDSSAYRTLAAGRVDLEVVPAGESIDQSVLTLGNVALDGETSHTAVVFDRLGALQSMVLVDDLAAVEGDRVRVRGIHVAPDVGQVDVWNVTNPDDPAPLFTNLILGDASIAEELEAGAYSLGIDVDGDGASDLFFDLPSLEAGRIVNLFIVQDEADEAALVLQFEDGTTERVAGRGDVPEVGPDQVALRMIHLGPDVPPLDLWVDDTLPVVMDIGFTEGSDFVIVDADISVVRVTLAGDSPADGILFWNASGLEAGNHYTAVVSGTLADARITVAQEDFEDVPEGMARLRIFHTAADFGTVGVWISRIGQFPTLVLAQIGFSMFGQYLEVPSGTYAVGLDATADGMLEVTTEPFALSSGAVVNAYAVTDMAGSPFLLVQDATGRIVRIEAVLEEPSVEPDVLAE